MVIVLYVYGFQVDGNILYVFLSISVRLRNEKYCMHVSVTVSKELCLLVNDICFYF